MERTVHDFLDYWQRIRQRTLRVARLVPAEQLEWRYHAGKFSSGDLLRHLAAIERYMFVENALLRPSRYPGHGRQLADGWEALFAFAERMHAESLELLGGLTDGDLERRTTTPGGASIPVWKWLRAMVEHEVHHRGQLYVYLAMLNVATPPLYGLTAEEVEARSVRS